MAAVPLVMVVEDEEGMLRLFGSMIERMGYRVLLAWGGVEAMNLLDDETPDLVVLDMAMPNVNGVAVLRHMNSVPRLDDMRVMVLTAIGPGPAPADVHDRIGLWVNKPVRPETFRQLIHRMLGAGG